MKLTEKSKNCFNYLKEVGGKATLAELAEKFEVNVRSISATVLDLTKKGLAVREKAVVGEDTITYAVLTEDGKAFDPEAKVEE